MKAITRAQAPGKLLIKIQSKNTLLAALIQIGKKGKNCESMNVINKYNFKICKTQPLFILIKIYWNMKMGSILVNFA